MPHVLVAGKLHPSGIALLKSRARRDLRLRRGDLRAELCAADRQRRRARHPHPAALGRHRAARRTGSAIVSRHGVGYDVVDLASLNERGIALAVCGDVNSVSVAEQAMMLMLAAAKRADPRRPRRARRRLGLAQPARAGRALGQAAPRSSASAAAGGTSRAWPRASAWRSAPSIRSSQRHGWPEGPVAPVATWPRASPGRTSSRCMRRRPTSR